MTDGWTGSHNGSSILIILQTITITIIIIVVVGVIFVVVVADIVGMLLLPYLYWCDAASQTFRPNNSSDVQSDIHTPARVSCVTDTPIVGGDWHRRGYICV